MKTPADQATTKTRIALYGGAFDPVHRAHLEVARAARRQASLDQVVFLPAAHSPLKAHGPVAGDADRLDMLELALGDAPDFVVDDSELRRGGLSYTVDTVRHFQAREPGAALFWILGGDQLAQLDRWQAIGDLVRRVTFLVVARPGYPLVAPEISGLVWTQIEAPLMALSSTGIRERLAQGASLEGCLPSSVEAFIREKGLYR